MIQVDRQFALNLIFDMKKPLIEKQVQPTIPADSCPITKYNYFLTVYNDPTNQVQGQRLETMDTHSFYSKMYGWFSSGTGKVLFTVLVIGLPFANILLMLASWYFAWAYFRELRIYNWNRQLVPDPFKNMVYDQQICHSLGKDHKYFEVELRDLQGFVFNYNQKMRQQLSLRRERGKVRFMVYSSDFWKCYSKYPQYKCYHLTLIIASTLIVACTTTLWLLLILH